MEQVNQCIGVEPIPCGGLAVHERADLVFDSLELRHGGLATPGA